MGTFTLYTLKAAFCLSLLYLPYALLLRRETFFHLNRAVLLVILALSAVLPAVDRPHALPAVQDIVRQAIPVSASNATVVRLVGADTTAVEACDTAGDAGPGWADWLVCLYAAGVLAVTVRQVLQYVGMRRFIRRGCLWTHRTDDGITIYCHALPTAPFSWMHGIVLSQADYDEHGREIVAHERAHVALHHSWDALAMALVRSWQWFNPFVHLLAADLRDLHEFEADRAVLRNGIDRRDYQLLILKKAAGTSSYALANSLNHSNNLKKRITMMKKKESSRAARGRLLWVLPAAAVAMTAMARPEVADIDATLSAAKVTNFKSFLSGTAQKRTAQAEAGGRGLTEPDRSVARNTSRTAQDSTVTGKQVKVFINGKAVACDTLSDIRPADIKEIYIVKKGTAADAHGQATKNGNIHITLQDKNRRDTTVVYIQPDEAAGNTGDHHYTVNFNGTKEQPLIVIDGRVVTEGNIGALNSNDIMSVVIVKGDEAVKSWGSRGKNGVVIIESSDGQQREVTFSGGGDAQKPATTAEPADSANRKPVVKGKVLTINAGKASRAAKTGGKKGRNR